MSIMAGVLLDEMGEDPAEADWLIATNTELIKREGCHQLIAPALFLFPCVAVVSERTRLKIVEVCVRGGVAAVVTRRGGDAMEHGARPVKLYFGQMPNQSVQ